MATLEATKSTLQKDIGLKKDELLKLAALRGFTNKDTVKCSQELDQLLNVYQKRYCC
ncbi:aspartyl-phosphate phosphatase Spo0E family protein [Fictibacillus aquaticus]|uniref:Spo0E family sporulation regulatory protein-aspartic acid phosphatase n=1 Tax=Fictibacillus aquaticus TaxID=2021314 RepID=A0A235FDX9_9BACL|nr:aspartyl-phosphate phosphatase Spo0E family protein [Fictibacillus aquaticus]OYD59576.1 Spo0E family sporulation regulatory protein-aspartic acid phosphatase [Fictibacillus aquaticus]